MYSMKQEYMLFHLDDISFVFRDLYEALSSRFSANKWKSKNKNKKKEFKI